MKLFRKFALPFAVISGIMIYFFFQVRRPPTARGKSPALPIQGNLSIDTVLAQDLALSDALVIDFTSGKRSEVFDVTPLANCESEKCGQVTIYNFDDNTAIIAMVDLQNRIVFEVREQPGMLPIANRRLQELAIQVIHEADEVANELGYHPSIDDIAPMPSSLAGTDCGYTHPCVGATFPAGDRFLWAHVDLTTEQLAGIAWSPAPEKEGTAAVYTPSVCPTPGTINRDGWRMNYEVTASDGLQIRQAQFHQVPVLARVKIAEWHVDYGNTGFIDATGCGGSAGQSLILPYGETQVFDLLDSDTNLIGFEIVQDFRMPQWGQSCNYRYEQRYQFYQDGRFRIVAAAFGRGCGTNAVYRPIIRIDLDLADPENERVALWNGSDWVDQITEFKLRQAEPYTPENYAWSIKDIVRDFGYFIEPGMGQFNDGGLGDNAYFYVTQHHAEEGDADMIALGACCEDNDQQGPHKFVDEESIDSENVVIWYVPELVTNAIEGSEYCWTVTGGETPEAYPCYSGPMFHPINLPLVYEQWFPIIRND